MMRFADSPHPTRYSRPTVIVAPVTQTTTINRDVFGMTHTVTQSGLY